MFGAFGLNIAAFATALFFIFSASIQASAHTHNLPQQMTMTNMHGDDHAMGIAPAGISGDNMPTGAWMLNYQTMHMRMEGIRIGTRDISPGVIATTIGNPNPGPLTLRVVPTEMEMNMHMAMLMFAPTDWITLMAMGSYVTKEMRHVTYQGAAGITKLGSFKTSSQGIGDIQISSIFKIFDDGKNRLQFSAGVSLPTGSITETDTVLTPAGTRPLLRLPYAMQLGTGTFDFLPEITYRGKHGAYSYGARYSGALRFGDGNQGYSFGDLHKGTLWAAYDWTPRFNTSLRLEAMTQGEISGRDPMITAPVQTAVPGFYGGERINLMLGLSARAPSGPLRGYQISAEVGVPVYQDLNGPQMKTDLIARVSLIKMIMP